METVWEFDKDPRLGGYYGYYTDVPEASGRDQVLFQVGACVIVRVGGGVSMWVGEWGCVCPRRVCCFEICIRSKYPSSTILF